MANQTYALVITGNSAGQFVQNIFHFRMDDDGFANRLLAAKGLIDGFLADAKEVAFLEMVPSAYQMMSIKARRVTNGGGPEWIDTSVASTPGAGGAGLQMSGAGPVILWFTDGGPRRVGKTFLPGIANANINGGEIEAAFLVTLNDEAETFRSPFPAVGGTTPTCTMVIPRTGDPATRSIVTANLVSKDLGVQRRRQLPV
jgi:hypothetical protein